MTKEQLIVETTFDEILKEAGMSSEELSQLSQEAYWVTEWLTRYGGSFSRNLGNALLCADVHNQIKIKNTWPELWGEALEHASQEE